MGAMFRDIIRVFQALVILLINRITYSFKFMNVIIDNYCCIDEVNTNNRDNEQLSQQFCIDNDLVEYDGTCIYGVDNHVVGNWANTIKPQSCITFSPVTKVGICNIVKWAKANNKKVRAGGYRHTFSKFYPDDDNFVFISMISLQDSELMPARRNLPINHNSDLCGINVVKVLDTGKALVKVGAATTNDQFREWCVNNVRYGGHAWTLPFNVILTEITLGGSNATMSHGGGIKHSTLSDLVREIEFVNVKGELQVVNDVEQLKAVAGSLGLFGITTSLTLELDVMTYANFQPYSEKVALTIPPPGDYNDLKLPTSIRDKFFKHVSHEEIHNAKNNFFKQCNDSYYSEWFWFVFSDQCFINVWDNDGTLNTTTANIKNNNGKSKSKGNKVVIDYPSIEETNFQKFSSYLADTVLSYIDMSSYWMSGIMGYFGNKAIIDSTKHAVTPIINALHFKRGIHDIKSRNTETMIPIPDDGHGNPDYSICQRAWWDLICLMYEYRYTKNYNPVQVTIEMRMVGNSNMYLAPEHGNHHGTCSIEFSTTGHADEKLWLEFCQQINNIWYNYKDRNGNFLKVRPHLAKEFNSLIIRGLPILEYLRDINRSEYNKFKQQASNVAQAGGYKRGDLAMFSNSSIDALDIY